MPLSELQKLLSSVCLPQATEPPHFTLPDNLRQAQALDLMPAHHKAGNHNLRKTFLPG